MNKKISAITLACFLVLACGLYIFFTRGDGSPQTAVSASDAAAAGQVKDRAPEGFQDDDDGEGSYAAQADATPLPHPKDIQEIKKQIYDLEIETVDDIPKLDRVVQTGNAQTRDYWTGDWTSVDDNKEIPNGFNLEPQPDGTFTFYPDEQTARTYTFFETPQSYKYDPAKREFSWDIDYYGKIITHRARFINNNVLAMMLISGSKVTLDIYQKKPEPPQGPPLEKAEGE
jgi:hypothetical protein